MSARLPREDARPLGTCLACREREERYPGTMIPVHLRPDGWIVYRCTARGCRQEQIENANPIKSPTQITGQDFIPKIGQEARR